MSSFLREDLRAYQPASNLHFNEKIKLMQKQGKEVHHLAFGQSPFPVPKFAQDVLRAHADDARYLSMRGIPELQSAICSYHQKEDGLNHFSTDDIIVGPGSKELIFLLLCVTGGDIILLSPTWTTYKPQSLLSRHRLFTLPTTFEAGWKLMPEHIDKLYAENEVKECSVLVLCNPDNPTGTAYTEQELRALSVVFRKHKILVVSDEIYARLTFNDNHVSLAKFYPEGTVLSSGISKWASCGGWRLGYQLYPPELKEVGAAVASAASHTYTCASAPIQHGAASLLRFEEEAKSYVKHCKRILEAVAFYCCKELRSAGVKVRMSDSGYYLFPDFAVIREGLAERGVRTGDEMCELILKETSVALMAGGPAYLHPPEELTVRLCYVNFDGAKALKASEAVGLGEKLPQNFLAENCAPTLDAISRITEWVKQQKPRNSKKRAHDAINNHY